MSLYDDLDLQTNNKGKETKSDISGWSSGYKLLQSQLQAKKANLLQSKSRRHGPSLAPVVDLKRERNSDRDTELHFNQQTGKLERINTRLGPSPFISDPVVPSFPGIDDEYNPLFPNDYEVYVKKRRKQREREKEENRQKELEERERRRKERHREQGYDVEAETEKRLARRRHEEEEDYDRPKRGGFGAAIAPPQSLIQEDQLPPEEENDPFSVPKPLPGSSIGLSGSVASKIMAKYGYKDGQGLGKAEQGMSQALLVEKTSKRGGKIIHEKDLPKETPRAEVTTADILKNPSKVTLLRNMVGPGEVDEELEPETAEECLKYGKVVKCLIFEMPNAEDEEAVRIFVEFERMESAIKAVVDLNGRYFGGRVVKAGFYNLDKFRRYDLADDPN